jgi:hypothetical protein
MGWLYMTRGGMNGHPSAKAYLDDQFTYERPTEAGGSRGLKVIASSCLQNRVWYAAAQIMTDGVGGDVVALICLVRWNPRDKEGMIFGYKDMDETMGPHEAECPARILDLLTPTDREYALAWRAKCRANLARRGRKLENGDRIRLPEPMKFTDGHEGSEFIVLKTGRRIVLFDPVSKLRYRITRLMERDWTIVPVTRVHKTLFA